MHSEHLNDPQEVEIILNFVGSSCMLPCVNLVALSTKAFVEVQLRQGGVHYFPLPAEVKTHSFLKCS